MREGKRERERERERRERKRGSFGEREQCGKGEPFKITRFTVC